MNINLNQLPLLQKVFKKLNSGCHVNRLEDTEIWIDLEKNQPPSEFADIDSAASNGTVLMTKLIIGLAMLNQMKDPRKTLKLRIILTRLLRWTNKINVI